MNEIDEERHVGRSFHGNLLEDTCPCAKAKCGLAISDRNSECPEHSMLAAKTIRQHHYIGECPAESNNGPSQSYRD